MRKCLFLGDSDLVNDEFLSQLQKAHRQFEQGNDFYYPYLEEKLADQSAVRYEIQSPGARNKITATGGLSEYHRVQPVAFVYNNDAEGLSSLKQWMREYDQHGNDTAKKLILCDLSGGRGADYPEGINFAMSVSCPIIFYDAKNPNNPQVAQYNQLARQDNKKYYGITGTDPCTVMRQMAIEVKSTATERAAQEPINFNQNNPRQPAGLVNRLLDRFRNRSDNKSPAAAPSPSVAEASAAKPRSVVEAVSMAQQNTLYTQIKSTLKNALDIPANEMKTDWNKPKLEQLEKFKASHPQLVSNAFRELAVDCLSRLKEHKENQTPMSPREETRVKERLNKIEQDEPAIVKQAAKLVSSAEVKAERRDFGRGK